MTATTTFGRVGIPRRMMKLARDDRGYPVPVVAEWSSETELILPPPIDEQFGPIAITTGGPGIGVPMLGNMQPSRQRRAMLESRCQVCDRDLRSSKFRFMAGGPKLEWFTEPWVCGPCMTFATAVCPGLIRAARHDSPLVVHHVKDVEFCQERVGPCPLGVKPVAVDEAMEGRGSWLAPFDYKSRSSALYFIRAHVVASDRYSAEGFRAAFDWSKELA